MKLFRTDTTLTETQFGSLLVILASLLGLLVRLGLPLVSTFPLNDGGLFYAMIRDLQGNRYLLPIFTSYNDANLPFAYPPFALYLTGLLADLTKIPLLEVFRLLPALISALSVPIYWLLAREVLPVKSTAALAAFLFAFTPRVFTWHIMGGGITRSFGLLFSLLTLIYLIRLYRARSVRLVLLATICASLTILTHPEAIPHTFLAALIIFIFMDRSRKGFIVSLLIGMATLVFTSPWWVTVILRHGLQPFIAAASTSAVNNQDAFMRLFSLFRFEFTGEPYLAWIAFFAVLGFIVVLVDRNFFLHAWLILQFVIEPRSGSLFMMIPLIMLSAMGLEFIFRYLARLQAPSRTQVKSVSSLKKYSKNGLNTDTSISYLGDDPQKVNEDSLIDYANIFVSTAPRVLFLFLTIYFIISAYAASYFIFDRATLGPVDLQAMQWVKANTPLDSTFILITGGQPLLDPTSDWFPVLASRKNLTTVFGYEWLPDGLFPGRVSQYNDQQACANRTAECLDAIQVIDTELGLQYVYIRVSEPTFPLEHDLRADTRYSLGYQSEGISIFRKLD